MERQADQFSVRLVHLGLCCLQRFFGRSVLFCLLLLWVLFPMFIIYNIAYQLFGWSQHLVVDFLKLFFG